MPSARGLILLAVLLAPLAACATTHTIDTSDRLRFTETARAMALEMQPPGELRADGPLQLLVGKGEEPWRIHLEDAWDFCQRSYRKCDEGVRRTLEGAFAHIRADNSVGE
ncbi:MAG: hypothetical protein H6744_19175 [Deltaproteobacteria bacterium]|nr:hypothetical protein [Deltaproteobacteria bacterium]MCB9788806.1 hypothetical protein [Deltaproteobacteria bacterium]